VPAMRRLQASVSAAIRASLALAVLLFAFAFASLFCAAADVAAAAVSDCCKAAALADLPFAAAAILFMVRYDIFELRGADYSQQLRDQDSSEVVCCPDTLNMLMTKLPV
jgi:hypothetical protein